MYRIRRAWAGGMTIWIAEYIGYDGQARYMMHAAVPDPIVKLINKLTGRDSLLYRRG